MSLIFIKATQIDAQQLKYSARMTQSHMYQQVQTPLILIHIGGEKHATTFFRKNI